MIVLAFDRDWTVDVNPHPSNEAVPLDWVASWAHEADHEVWAIGNQDLVYEAGIPGVVELIRRSHGNLDALGDQDDDGYYEWWPTRERRLELLADLFPDASHHIVVDDLDLSHVDGWDHYTGWAFRDAVEGGPLNFLDSTLSIETDDATEGAARSGDDGTIQERLRGAAEVEIVLDERGEDRFRSRDWSKPRPSALPIDAPPTFDFTTETGETRRIELPEVEAVTVVEDEPDANGDGDPGQFFDFSVLERSVLMGRSKQVAALTTAQRVEFAIDVFRLSKRSSAYPKKLINNFALVVDGIPDENTPGFVRATNYAVQYPEHLAEHVDGLCNLARVSETPVSRRAVWCLMELAEADPQAVVDAVPTLAVALERKDEETRTYATYAHTCVSETYPAELLPALESLLERLDDGSENVRTNALSAVGRIVHEYPDTAVDYVDDVAELLESDGKMARNNAVGILADVAQKHPGAVIEYADEIAARLDDSNIQARINASIVLLRAGEADLGAVCRQHERLEAALEDPSPEVRANACVLIANSEAPVPVANLRELRSDDPNETVRDHATWAVRRLS